MKKCLKKRVLFHRKNGQRVTGPTSNMTGDCSGLRGDCYGLCGNCSGLIGDLDKCEIPSDERTQAIMIHTDLVEENANDTD